MFELCVGSTRFGVEAVDVHNTQVLAMEVVLAKVLSEATSQCHIFGWCFWFVWLVCWSVCRVTGDVSDEFISHSFVAEWREEINFGLLVWGVCSQWEWQVWPNARPLSRSILAFWLFFRFLWAHHVSGALPLLVLVRSTWCVKGQFIQHFLWRATWQDHHGFISLRRHLSVRVLSATERLLVVVRVCSISCHARRPQETRVSSSVRMIRRLNHFAGLVWVCCMKCLSVVPVSFSWWGGSRAQSLCYFSGGLHS